MQIMEVTWGRAARVWWSLLWRTLLITLLLSLIIGIIAGLTMSMTAADPKALLLTQLLGMLCGIAGGIYAVKKVLEKEYRDYRVALIPSTEAQMQQMLDSE